MPTPGGGSQLNRDDAVLGVAAWGCFCVSTACCLTPQS